MLSKRDLNNPDKKISRLRKVLFELSSSEPISPSISTNLPSTDISDLLTWYAKGQHHFQGMALSQTNLVRAHLPFIDLSESNLSKANLSKANLAGATLNHTDFTAANLSEVNLIGAEMIRAKLTGANLSKALMSSANMSGANLRKADLRGASFAGANLSGVDFSGAMLQGACLEGANLKGANFSNTDLSRDMIASLDLEDVILSPTQNALLWELSAHEPPAPHPPEPVFYLSQPSPSDLLWAGDS
ncbi:MAG: pentapeptide repeat-containing protein [Leptolyngbyaceae cyanobacterium bins.59]|nr:pentapeptide repeat-containing protein [Leptolyngbyaceae cyanobacterium bins.59]